VIFPTPSPSTFDALQLDLPLLAQRMRSAVIEWRGGSGDTEATRTNEKRMVQWYPNGLAPYMVGWAVLT
jgi:hypothetical protein